MATATESRNSGASGYSESGLDAVIAATQSAIEARQDLMQMRMENETIMAECRARPRDMTRIKHELSEMLKVFPALALQARYCKPCGKDEHGRGKEARGLSIRAAEVLAEVYGFNRVRVDVTPIQDGLAKVDATFTDFQNGRIWQDGGVVSQKYKDREGKIRTTPDDRFWSVVCKAEASKRVREVILRSVNAPLKRWFETECIKAAANMLDADTMAEVVSYFKGLGVGLAQLDEFVGRPKSMGWTNEDNLRLLELRNAIEEGEVTVNMAFGIEPRPQGQQKVGRSAINEALASQKRPADDGNQDAGDPLAGLHEALAACKSKQDCQAVAKRFYKPGLSEDQINEVSAACDEKADTLPDAAKGKQKTFNE